MRHAKRILLTGFEPFAGAVINPSAKVVAALDGSMIAKHQVVGHVLPCEFRSSIRSLKIQIKSVVPGLVICLGQAGGREGITLERVAINIDDARIPDNAGVQPIDRPIVKGGPAAYWSTLPIKAMVAALRAQGIPASVSQTAGTYVCNHVFYGLMHALRGQTAVRGGFIHLPWLPTQGSPDLPLETMTAGIRLIMKVAASRKRDEAHPDGSLH